MKKLAIVLLVFALMIALPSCSKKKKDVGKKDNVKTRFVVFQGVIGSNDVELARKFIDETPELVKYKTQYDQTALHFAVIFLGIIIAILGSLIGVLGSMFAVGKYLNV